MSEPATSQPDAGGGWSVPLRYAAAHLRSWLLALLLAWLAWRLRMLPGWLSVGLLGLWLLKDLLVYPRLRDFYAPRDEPEGVERLVGLRAEVVSPLRPVGMVRLGHELWRAELSGGGRLEAACRVRVVAARGLTLEVQPEPED